MSSVALQALSALQAGAAAPGPWCGACEGWEAVPWLGGGVNRRTKQLCEAGVSVWSSVVLSQERLSRFLFQFCFIVAAAALCFFAVFLVAAKDTQHENLPL